MIEANFKSQAWKFDMLYISLILMTFVELVLNSFLVTVLYILRTETRDIKGYRESKTVVYLVEFFINSLLIGLRLALMDQTKKSVERQEEA